MFTDSRSIDDRATAASFDSAYQKYAAAADSWFTGSPDSIDSRLAQCNRLMHIARHALGRRGANTGPLTNLASLEEDARALIALRHDLLTGAYDREDTSSIAGVRIAAERPSEADWDRILSHPAPESWGRILDKQQEREEQAAWERSRSQAMEKSNREWQDSVRGKKRDQYGDIIANCGDDEPFEGGEHDDDNYEGPLVASSEHWQGYGDQGHPQASDIPWSERKRIRGSRHIAGPRTHPPAEGGDGSSIFIEDGPDGAGRHTYRHIGGDPGDEPTEWDD
jgi:hypothetical protein